MTAKTIQKFKPESPLQKRAFLTYFNMGEKRSLRRLQRELGKSGTKISDTSIAKWSGIYKWVERVNKMDREVYDKTEELAIKNAIIPKSKILEVVKTTMEKYLDAIMSGKVVPTAKDFKQMWEIARVELGLDKGLADERVPSFTKIDQKVLIIINKAEKDIKEIIESNIQNE